MQICQSQRLVIRTLNDSDAPMILQLLNEKTFIENIGDKGVRDLEGALRYINDGPLAMQKALGYSLYCCQLSHSNNTIGICGLIKRDGVEYPEVGFAFLSQYCRQGFGLESLGAVVEYALSVLNLPVLQAICNPGNLASIALLQRLGFSFKSLLTLPSIEHEIKLYEKRLNG